MRKWNDLLRNDQLADDDGGDDGDDDGDDDDDDDGDDQVDPSSLITISTR